MKSQLTKNYYALKSRCMKEFGTLEGTILESKKTYVEWFLSNYSEGDKYMLVRRDTSKPYTAENCYMGTRADSHKTRGTGRGSSGHKYVIYDRHYGGYLYRRNSKALFASKDLNAVLEYKQAYERGEEMGS